MTDLKITCSILAVGQLFLAIAWLFLAKWAYRHAKDHSRVIIEFHNVKAKEK